MKMKVVNKDKILLLKIDEREFHKLIWVTEETIREIKSEGEERNQEVGVVEGATFASEFDVDAEVAWFGFLDESRCYEDCFKLKTPHDLVPCRGLNNMNS